jgi:hypothetical protein
MGRLLGITELLFKGVLASYLLVFAFEMHKHPLKFVALITSNLQLYLSMLGGRWEQEWAILVESHMLHYCQFLVVMSMAVVCGMRFGKALGWLAIVINLALTWSKT